MTASRSATKLTPETHKLIVDLVRAGRPVSIAADAARIRRATVYDWLQRGEAGIAEYTAFHADILAARSEAFGHRVDRIDAAGEDALCPTCTCEPHCVAPGDWKAHAWLGERLYPKELQLTQKHEHVVQQGVESVLVAVRAHMSSEAYGQLVSAVARVRGVDTPPTGGADESEPRRIGSGD